MNDYILFMHNDAPEHPRDSDGAAWGTYFAKLNQLGCFQGGSSIGAGVCLSKSGTAPTNITRHLSGYIKIRANSLSEVQELVIGNPVFEAGGTVEIRELLKD